MYGICTLTFALKTKSPSFVGFYIPAPWFAYGNRMVSPNYQRQRIWILSTGTFLIIFPKSDKNWKSPKLIQCGGPQDSEVGANNSNNYGLWYANTYSYGGL